MTAQPTAVAERVVTLRNGGALPSADIPLLDIDDLQETVLRACESGSRLAAFFGERIDAKAVRLTAVLARAGAVPSSLASARVADGYSSWTPDLPQAHLFEREIFEQWSVNPIGHPWRKPVRFLAADVAGSGAAAQIGVMPFFHVEGEEVHEVGVGPVHAGVIEPGHFRFQCAGEEVLHLEISLGYQHRGVERALMGAPHARSLALAETAAGDSTIAHATAYSLAMEGLAGAAAERRGAAIRSIALELERMANHVGDLGALSGDIGFLPSAAWCGRLRGDFLNLTTALTGSRLGRGLAAPGGARLDVDGARADELVEGVARALSAARNAVDLLWSTTSVRDRFEGAGPLTREQCEEMGIVGVAARACAVARDVRREFPFDAFSAVPIESRIWPTGDVLARARVRWMEVEQSAEYVTRLLKALPEGSTRSAQRPLAPSSTAVAATEGWRGEVFHIARTGPDGRIALYKIVDPSFHNWMGLALAMRGQAISDFPLVNKSFNLSYCGHDL